uniref:hypothetical protein n=1 Tax=Parerythrobacter lutipelagi TaxID=1964208 RepID=UPI0010F54934|nr:hypothetical protein [Parerythrobacter lutipelagi]
MAFVILLIAAASSSLFWNAGKFEPVSMLINLTIATAGMILLHFKWRRAERKLLASRQTKDVFS